MPPLKIENIEFQERTGSVKVPRVLLFVGPNSSGKSLALQEVYSLLRGASYTSGRTMQIVKKVSVQVPSNKDELFALIEPTIFSRVTNDPDNCTVLACSESGDFRRIGVNLSYLDNIQSCTGDTIPEGLRAPLLEAFLISPRLETLLNCWRPKKMQVFSRPDVAPENLQQFLVKYPDRITNINRVLFRNFKKIVWLQPLNNSEVSFVISKSQPPEKQLAFNPSQEMQAFYSDCSRHQNFGDGFRVFASLVTLVYATNHKLLILDEPEIYLHAPLVRTLAADLIEEFDSRDGTIVAATHSADFIAGCLASTSNVVIVRTTYSEEKQKGKVSVIEHETLKRFVENPVLRNIDALPGLFYEAIIVVEGQGDKVAYSEVNRRLNSSGKGIRDAFFISATGKMNIVSVVEPFVSSGIPTATICDFDIFNDKSVGHLKTLTALSASPAQELYLKQIDEVVKILKQYEFEDLKSFGVRKLSSGDSNKVTQVILALQTLGIFIVPTGELESWYGYFGIAIENQKKVPLLNTVLEKIADEGTGLPHDLSSPLKSIWAFLHAVSKWVNLRQNQEE